MPAIIYNKHSYTNHEMFNEDKQMILVVVACVIYQNILHTEVQYFGEFCMLDKLSI